MNVPVKEHLAEVRRLIEADNSGSAEATERWKELGIFFENLAWYGVNPEDPGLLKEAEALASASAAARRALGMWAKDVPDTEPAAVSKSSHTKGAVLVDSDEETGRAKKQRTA
ncbi:DTC [Symbiodinium pilosum]|uniref:DTC protein n=1 Tax=Symbiodinium pilosum TaxID=2952 RepID=A0A812RDJ5_SYMPI|nr:DTC [Symbiodinium pilosum]